MDNFGLQGHSERLLRRVELRFLEPFFCLRLSFGIALPWGAIL